MWMKVAKDATLDGGIKERKAKHTCYMMNSSGIWSFEFLKCNAVQSMH